MTKALNASKFFKTDGPIRANIQYHLDPLTRFNLEEVLELIQQSKYFSIYGPPQTGKTSSLLALSEYLEGDGIYKSLYVDLQAAKTVGEEPESGIPAIASALAGEANNRIGDTFPERIWQETLAKHGVYDGFREILTRWCQANNRPIVLLLDNMDVLSGYTQLSLLRQIRTGYLDRPRAFPRSIILCGLHDVQDYRLYNAAGEKIINNGSVFNIKATSIRLSNFSRLEVQGLIGQSGQCFDEQAVDGIMKYTRGHPWLVNALANECVRKGHTETITGADVLEAKETVIRRGGAYLNFLMEKLSEERVRRVIEPILAGHMLSPNISSDDRTYVRDLGLVTTTPELTIANPIYQEVILRVLIRNAGISILQEYQNWLDVVEGKLDWSRIWEGFLEFWREKGDLLIVEGQQYFEVVPQMVLMAYMQCFVNSKGHIKPEFAIGCRCIKLLVRWPYELNGNMG